ncbi:MAG: MotA/TolQ/ExbB proton channel family protein [Bacteriovoracaceae bacterium]|jgi:biopolymer transport protein ExbB|nr:MotA/TolQ/ExbB proton channel family protein [Bacteriovoracaceae bacterium]
METQTIPSPVESVDFLTTAAKFMDEGGIFMWIILAVWIFGICVAIERFKILWSLDIDGPSLMSKVKKAVLNNQIKDLISELSGSKALLPLIFKSGLKRANRSREQIVDAVESSVLESIPKLEKRMNYLSLVANVSTLVGLLGTIYGLIESFAAVASADPSKKAELLALGISKAMNTTALGLISAISIMVVHTILSSRSDKILGEIDQYSIKLVDLLGGQTIRASNTSSEDLPGVPTELPRKVS